MFDTRLHLQGYMGRRAMSNPVRFLGIALVKSADLTRHRRFINHKDQGPYLATHGSIQYTAINQSIDRPIDSSSHAKRRTNQVEVELARARRESQQMGRRASLACARSSCSLQFGEACWSLRPDRRLCGYVGVLLPWPLRPELPRRARARQQGGPRAVGKDG